MSESVSPHSAAYTLCLEGIRAEFERRIPDARLLYQAAWDASNDHFDACIAAHYIAHLDPTPESAHAWNLEALKRATLVQDDRVKDFFPSLHVNLGHTYELLGDDTMARHHYSQAGDLARFHDVEPTR